MSPVRAKAGTRHPGFGRKVSAGYFPAMIRTVRILELTRFWAPLQATWLMMAVEGPFLAAMIARMAEPKHNLAAYGVAFALAILVEAPVIMMMSAATALVDGADNFRKLRNFMLMLNGGITSAMLLLLLTPAWGLVTDGAMNLDPEVARLVRTSLFILLPWPAAIGLRRFYQGVLIRSGRTQLVAWGTAIRLSGMGLTAMAAYRWTPLEGAWAGAAGLSAGVVSEAAASWLMARPAVREVTGAPSLRPLGYREIERFYRPLALTSVISLAVQPLVTFFMGLARYPLESLAVLPVVTSLVFIFRTPGLSFQEAAITMLGRTWDNAPMVRRFAVILGAGAGTGLAVMAWTPLAGVWLHSVAGLSPDLAAFALPPIRILVLMPPLSVLLSLQRALMVARRDTGPITWASVLEVAGIAAVLVVAVPLGHWVGATAAAVAFLIGRLASNIFLLRGMGRVG
ncbi:MAG: hypothetical protein AB7V45_14190 [Candidatus Krumholzibacteriia bacterium]